MKKSLLLIRTSMTEDMNLFKISTKKKNTFTKILPILIALMLMGVMSFYSELIIKELISVNMGFVLLTIFILLTSIVTIIEGIYKSGNMLFNAKDDNLLLSLPIKRSTVLFIRVFKFYIFELLYNSLFLLPSIIVYAIHMNPSFMYYVISIIGLLLFPIIPIIISCLIGFIITFFASKFKSKNIVQTIITFILLIGIMYFSYNSENLIMNIAQNASSINDLITKIYYPAGAYIELITSFSIFKLLEFILIHLSLFTIIIILIGKIYFKINSVSKSVKVNKSNKKYVIRTNSIIFSLVKKEFNRFINSTVFVTNAAFGLVLFVIGCILITIKFDSIENILVNTDLSLSLNSIKYYLPVALLFLISFASFMTSITSSMISLEGKSFNVLKSLPISPYIIIKSKVLSALLVMIPCILIGNIIIFINFKFNLMSIVLIILASIILPLLSEIIGIIVNLKYPKMDAKNDTEVVKQSVSSTICVFFGLGLSGLNGFLLYQALNLGISNNIIILLFLSFYSLITIGLILLLYRKCDKWFNNIKI